MSDIPFDVLMKQAAALKTSQLAVDRTKFDSWDSWYQHSLFAREDVKIIRQERDLDTVLQFARDCKSQGNNHYKDADFDGAINQYERCLSVFEWVEPTDPDWKNKGLQDKFLVEKRIPVEDSLETAREVEELKISCLLNLSMCFWKTNEWANCIRASNRVLEIDPINTKALYRRAQARIIPAYCGTTENLMALEDLKKAVQIKPDDSLLTTAYAELKISLANQKQKDKKTFNNLFERKVDADDPADEPYHPSTATSATSFTPPSSGGHVTSSSSRKEGGPALTWQDAFDMVKDMESAAARCEREGQAVQAAAIRVKKDELQKQMRQYFPAHLQPTAFPELEPQVVSPSSSTSSIPSVASSPTSSSSAGKKSRSKQSHTAPSPTEPTTGTSTSTLANKSPTARPPLHSTTPTSGGSNNSKVTTAAGGERGAAWYDAYGNGQDFVDFANPTAEMIQDAQSRGLDLTDPRVQQLMQEINKVRLKNTRMEEQLGRGVVKGKGKDSDVTAERMEAYMQEALENLHSEEASRITAALVADVAVPALRKMLLTRQEFQAKQSTTEAENEEVHHSEEDDSAQEYASHSGSNASKTHTGSTSTFRRSSRAAQRGAGASVGAAKPVASKYTTITTHHKEREGETVFDTAIDAVTCDADELRTVLQAMMVADIVQLRRELGKEEAAQRTSSNTPSTTSSTSATTSTRQGKTKGKLPPPATPVSEGLTPEEAEEEAQRLSLSERIVDMLEERYGTAMHSGSTTAATNHLLNNATIMAAIACVVLLIVHLAIRVYVSYNQSVGDVVPPFRKHV